MGKRGLEILDDKRNRRFSVGEFGVQFHPQGMCFNPGGLFANVGQVGMGFDTSPQLPNPQEDKNGLKFDPDFFSKYLTLPDGIKVPGLTDEAMVKKEKGGIKFKITVKNQSLRRLISGAVAGTVSRTVVAPLETIRTHLMLGSGGGHSTIEVFNNIVKTDGWKGLFRGNMVNVIRVAPSRAIELFSYDTANNFLSTKSGERPIPASLVAGAFAGVTSTLVTYPLELLKTRLTIQKDIYDGLFDAFVKILKEGGIPELYRGLTPSLIGVVPYAATNYFAYDTLCKAYKKMSNKEDIGNIETLLIGSAAGAISSSTTYPLEVARKHMQVGTLCGHQVYDNLFHALSSILENEGLAGLYKGVVPSCVKLVPAAGISFMCYEACKRILVEEIEE